MLLVSYDISDDKLRSHFSKFLTKYGSRLQYSVYQIKNSQRVLEIIGLQIEKYYGRRFSQRDSV